LIDETGRQLGIYPIREALQVAEEKGLDLVEVAPNARPPVCRLLNYSKFMYERARKEREARRAQRRVDIKEIQVRPKTAEHDLRVKLERGRRFLNEGHKLRVRVRFRGREITHRDLALELLARIAQEFEEEAVVEQQPAMEGRAMLMILAPKKKEVAKA